MDALELLGTIETLKPAEVASQSVGECVELIADLNAAQLAEGKRSDGRKMSRRGANYYPYAELTIELKSGKPGLSGVTDRVTLYDTGAFYKGLYAAVQGEDITFGSHDEKELELDYRYGTEKNSIFGLTEESREELITSKLQSTWESKVTEITGLSFE